MAKAKTQKNKSKYNIYCSNSSEIEGINIEDKIDSKILNGDSVNVIVINESGEVRALAIINKNGKLHVNSNYSEPRSCPEYIKQYAVKDNLSEINATEYLDCLKHLTQYFFFKTTIADPLSIGSSIQLENGVLNKAAKGDWMILVHEYEEKGVTEEIAEGKESEIAIAQFTGNNWEIFRVNKIELNTDVSEGEVNYDVFLKLQKEAGLLQYYLINFNHGNIYLGLYAKIDEKVFRKFDKSTTPTPMVGDRVIVLHVTGPGPNKEFCALKASGRFLAKSTVAIEKDSLIFNSIPYGNLLKAESPDKLELTETKTPALDNDQRAFMITKADFDKLHEYLIKKHNQDPHNYYYFGLGKDEFDIFTGKKQPQTEIKAVSGFHKINTSKFTENYANGAPITTFFKPKKDDFALIFYATGQNDPEQPAKFFGKIVEVNDSQEIKFEVVNVNTIDYCQIAKIINNKKNIINSKFKNADLSGRFTPFQVSKDTFEKMLNICFPLISHHNIVFNGAPGTGKTYMAKQIAKMLDAETKFVQFHPSYDYTDFVEGLRPVLQNNQQNAQTNGTNQGSLTTIGFERRDGHFKEFCAKAAENMAASMGKEIDWGSGTLEEKMAGKEDLKKFVFIIDEINRGDMSKIFGELFYSIECGYRVSADKLEEAIKENSEYTIQTQYQNLIKDSKNPEEKHYFQNGFFVPDNVYIIGTMNDIDRSVESMDFAMRRRFTFIEITPEEAKGMLYGELPPDLAGIAVEKMDAINNIISKEIGPEFQIGPAYFLDLKDDSNFESLWKQRIEPLIKEYRRGEDKAETDSLLDKLKKAYDGNQNP